MILGLLGMIWWFHLQNRPALQAQTQSKPQEYMLQLNITNYNESGALKEILRADYWGFTPSQGRSDLLKPYMIVYKPNGDVWHLSAQQGSAWHPTMGDKITQIDLNSKVILERTAENAGTPTIITTEQMQYFPGQDMLSSKEFIAMQQPGIMISGVGMSGYLDKNRIELHEQIRTVYTPNNS